MYKIDVFHRLRQKLRNSSHERVQKTAKQRGRASISEANRALPQAKPLSAEERMKVKQKMMKERRSRLITAVVVATILLVLIYLSASYLLSAWHWQGTSFTSSLNT